MDDELLEAAALMAAQTEKHQEVILDPTRPEEVSAELTRPLLQAPESQFTRDQEADAVANFLGLWISSVMFADLAHHQSRSQSTTRKAPPGLRPEPEPQE